MMVQDKKPGKNSPLITDHFNKITHIIRQLFKAEQKTEEKFTSGMQLIKVTLRTKVNKFRPSCDLQNSLNLNNMDGLSIQFSPT
jgi:hypothetical protein